MALLLLAGCAPPARVFEDKQGFRLTPPPGWVERAREDTLSGRAAHRQTASLPLPPLAADGKQPERLVVRYDRVTSEPAWLRVSVTDVPAASARAACLANCAPGRDWKREGTVEDVDVGGLPAARLTLAGRWNGHAHVNETVAVRHGEQTYLITASFPAADTTARAQVRQAFAGATWP